MTIKNLRELVQMHFPEMGATQLLAQFKLAERLFALETKCLRGQVLVPVTEDTVTYDLPDEIDAIERILVLDENEKKIDDNLTVTIENRVVFFMDSAGEEITTMPATASQILFDGIKHPPDITSEADEPAIDKAFHMALVYMILKDAYSNQMQAGYYRNEYDRLRKDAKKWASRQWDSTESNVRFHHM